MKWIKIVSVAVGALIAVVIFLVVIGVPARVLASSLSRQLEASTGLRLQTIGFAKLAILPELGLTLDDVAVEDATTGRPVFSTRRARFGIALGSLLTGQIRVTEIALTGSALHLGRWGGGAVRTPAAAPPGEGTATRGENFKRLFAVEQLAGEDATFIVDDGRDRTELRLDSLRLNSSLSPSHDRLSVKIEARSGSNALALRMAAESPGQLLEEKPVRIEATIEPGGALQSPATIAGNLQLAGPVLKIDGIAGTFERGRVGGSLSVSFARAKPFVDADVDVERLDLTAIEPTVRTPRNAEAKPEVGIETTDVGRGGNWSTRTINLGVLRVFEGNARVAAREIVLDKVHLGPANLEATLLEDNLSVVLTRSDLYGGQGKGELTFDVTQQQPRLGLRFDLSGVNVLPILTDAADFRYVDGHGAAKFDLKAAGESPLAIVSSLEGTASFVFQDGELRGLNLPHMLRSLLETVLSGWQTNASDRTKFSSFAASFQIKDGQARTDDLRFLGPFVRVTGSGNANLVDKTLDFRLDPKLVTSSAAPTSGAESGSLGVPVLVNGPWSKPQIYADLPGILTNPAAALGKLRAGDKALPGGAGNLTKQLDDLIGGRDGGGLGDLLKQLIPR